MKYGYCANLNFLLTGDAASREVFRGVLDAGYDYIEMPLSAFLKITPEQRASLEADLRAAGVPCRANFLLFPHELPLVGPELDLAAIEAHAERVLPIAADLGSETVVFGNGGSRRVREGMDREAVWRDLASILRTVAPVAERYGVDIAVEPLCQKETNMINSFPEGAALARAANSPRIGAVMDWYHVASDGQDPVVDAGDRDRLFHLHIANPEGRTVPARSDDVARYAPFVAAMRAARYEGRLSIEAGIPDGKDARAAIAEGLEVVRGLFG